MVVFEKLKESVAVAPVGAAVGAIVGYLIAQQLGYHKNLPVVSFVMVGLIIGSTFKK